MQCDVRNFELESNVFKLCSFSFHRTEISFVIILDFAVFWKHAFCLMIFVVW
jgi:hypothetical protein